LPETDEDSASEIVKRLLSNVQKMDDDRLHLSVGFCSGELGSNLVDIFRLADERMYSNKRG
jgi:GGDEF domain-containing protein